MTRSGCARLGLLATILMGLVEITSLRSVHADERHWNDPAGGRFDDHSNWDDGGGGVPGFYDVAVFDVGGVYEVLFTRDWMTDRALLRSGAVTFRMDPRVTYTLVNPLSPTPGLLVGGPEDAELILEQRSSIESRYAVVGDEPGTVGALTATGPEVALHVDHELRVAHRGVGMLTVSGGAAVASGSAAIGVAEGSLGAVHVTGGGTAWTCSGPLTVASAGEGELTIGDGATLDGASAVVARRPGSFGSVVVRGSASSLTIAGTLDVGMRGFAAMLVDDGARVLNRDFATIGTFPWEIPGEGGVGTVTVHGHASSWEVGGDLHIGFLGHGALVLSEGGRVAVDGHVYRASGDGTTRFVIELGSGADYPIPALLTAGTTDDLEPIVVLVDAFVPRAGDVFEIVRADGGVGTFAFTLPDLPNALDWQVVEEAGALSLLVVSACGPADLDGNGLVDFGDILPVLDAWGPCSSCPEDLDGSGVVDFGDVLLVLADWGPCE